MEEMLTVGQAAKLLGCHPETVRRLDRKNVLRAKRDYRGYRVFNKEGIFRLKKDRERLRDGSQGGVEGEK